MTDGAPDQSTGSATIEPRNNQNDDSVQLEYPQLLLEASLHSLLTHSHSSAASTVVNTMPSSNPLSSSWASISDVDYTQDDDLHSETTDTGSLIDASSIQDVHSVDDSGDISEAEEQDEQPLDHNASESSNSAFLDKEFDLIQPPEQLSGSRDMAVVDDALNTSLCTSHPVRSDSPEIQSMDLGTSSLSHTKRMSRHRLNLQEHGPLRVLVLKTNSVSADAQEAVLCKIGAAIVTDTSSHMSTSNYHIIPSGFGPGVRPDTSELIPITQQMTVYEAFFPNPLDPSASCRSPDGSPISFTAKGVSVKQTNGVRQQPDLILSMTSHNDSEEQTQIVQQSIDALDQLPMPILFIKETTSQRSSQVTREGAAATSHIQQPDTARASSSSAMLSSPVDLDQFLAEDSEDLFECISIMITQARNQNETSRTTNPFRAALVAVQDWLESLSEGPREAEWRQNSPDQESSDQSDGHSISKQARYFWSLLTPMRGAGLVVLIALLFNIILFGTSHMWNRSIKTIDPPGPGFPEYCIRSTLPSSTSHSAVKTTEEGSSSTALSKGTDVSLLSSMLHDVAEYLPLPRFTPEHGGQNGGRSQEQATENQGRECGVLATFAKVHRGRTLVVPEDFYQDGNAIFNVVIMRGRRAVPFTLEDLGHGRNSIKIDSNEVSGLLKILLSIPTSSRSRICAHLDLRDTSIETLAGIIDQGRRKNDEITQQPTQWTLLRIQRDSTRRWPAVREVSQLAMRTVEAVHAAVEDKVVSQIVACYHNSEDCWLGKARRYERQAVMLAQECEGKILATARRIQDRAGKLAHDMAVHASRALKSINNTREPIKDFPSKLKRSQSKLAAKLAHKAAKAQGRAQRLMLQAHRRR